MQKIFKPHAKLVASKVKLYPKFLRYVDYPKLNKKTEPVLKKILLSSCLVYGVRKKNWKSHEQTTADLVLFRAFKKKSDSFWGQYI